MRSPRCTYLLAPAFGALLLVAGCGGGELPATDAQAMLRDLGKVEQGVRAGECQATRPTLRRLDRNVASIPDDVDPDVRRTLDRGVDHLGRLVGRECKQRESDPVVTEPEPITPAPVDSTPEPSPTITEPPPEHEDQRQEAPEDENKESKEDKAPEKQERPESEQPKEAEEPRIRRKPKELKGDGRDPCPPGSSAVC
ncbi:MAG: hypothetical protein M3088_00165 [Actinomycetota bacterium]|nr:hypothetical protein [Actinomycetota bacterium]